MQPSLGQSRAMSKPVAPSGDVYVVPGCGPAPGRVALDLVGPDGSLHQRGPAKQPPDLGPGLGREVLLGDLGGDRVASGSPGAAAQEHQLAENPEHDV